MAGPIDLVVIHQDSLGAQTLLDDVLSVRISRGTDSKNSTCNITLQNANSKHITDSTGATQWNLNFDDTIIVAASWSALNPGSPVDSSNIANQYKLFVGVITAIQPTWSGKSAKLKIMLADKTDVVLSKAYIGKYEATGSYGTSSLMVKNLIDVSNEGQTVQLTTTHPTTGNSTIETTTNTFSYYTAYKPIYEHIKAVSVPQYTGGTRSATYFVDEANVFYWYLPIDAVSTTLNGAISDSATTITLTSTTDFLDDGVVTIDSEIIRYAELDGNDIKQCIRGYGNSIAASHINGSAVSNLVEISPTAERALHAVNPTKSTDDVINMIIMRLGKDKNGTSITWYKYNEQTTTSRLRMKIMDWRAIADDYYTSISGSAITKVDGDFTSSTGSMSISSVSTSDWTNTSGYVRVGSEIMTYSGVTSGGGFVTALTINGRGKYNTAETSEIKDGTPVLDWTDIDSKTNTVVRNDIKNKGEKQATSWFSGKREKLKLRITLDGTRLRPNDLISLTCRDVGINGAKLRIKGITQNISKNSWTTQLQAEEDDNPI